ncbi:MAG TPA: hypothetical protein VLY03_07225 [Bacteroidota bacterium]|nr:hypothetical protein [Bacteroidota bacterium]
MIRNHEEIAAVTRKLEELSSELKDVEKKIPDLLHRQNEIIAKMETLKNAYNILTGSEYPEKRVLMGEHDQFQSGMTIGDAIELVLRARGPLTRSQLLIELLNHGVSLGETNPRGSLHNAIKRDARKRFEVLENGRVFLRNS